MRSAYTTFAIGSFATGTAAPRSDADIVVVVAEADEALRRWVWEVAWAIFLGDAPVPVDLLVIPAAQLAHEECARRGIAAVVAREELRLG